MVDLLIPGPEGKIEAKYRHNINDKSSFTYLSKEKYNAIRIFCIKEYALVFKTPYLRDSFVQVGMPVSNILIESSKNTFILATAAISFALFILTEYFVIGLNNVTVSVS